MAKAILVDAMSTIFRFKGELNKYEILSRLIAGISGEKVPIERVKEVYERKRAEFESRFGAGPGAIPSGCYGAGHFLAKWTRINKEILLSLFPKMTEETAENLGKSITKKMASGSSLYQVSRDAKDFLKTARKKKIRVIIASNQDSDCLDVLIKDFKLRRLLYKAYSSSAVGLEKPDPRFFKTILNKEGLAAKDCVMIGNNLKNDVLAAGEAKLTGVLLDPGNLYPDYKGYRISRFKDFWSLDILKETA